MSWFSYAASVVVAWFKTSGPVLLTAAVIILAGVILSGLFSKLAARIFKRARPEPMIRHLLVPAVRWGTLLVSFSVASVMILNRIFYLDTGWIVAVVITVINAVLIFAIGCVVINIAIKIMRHVLNASSIETTFHPFLLSSTRAVLFIILAVICIDALGISTASLVTTMASLGLALSLSVKDHLSNLIGGLMILITKPFIKGDYIQINDCSGLVDEIGLIYTTLKTFDNRKIFIPNNDSAQASIINHSAESVRRADMSFRIGYQSDFKKAQELILEAANQTGLVLSSPPPMIRMSRHADNYVEITCRLWVEYVNLLELQFRMNEGVKNIFDREGIPIPYPQVDLHMKP